MIAWTSAAAAVVISGLAVVLPARSGWSELPWKQMVVAATWAVPGALIAAGRPRLPVGWLILGVALVFAGSVLADRRIQQASTFGTDDGVHWAIWFTDRFSALLVVFTFLALILLPDGRLPSRRWRGVAWSVAAVQLATVVAWSLVDGPAAAPDSTLAPSLRAYPNPLGILPPAIGELLQGLEVPVLQVPLLLCPAVFVARLRRAEGDERARIGVILLAATAFVLLVVIGRALWPAAASVLDIAAAALFATVLATAVLKRRLHGVDVVVHHTVVFVLLTMLIAGLYVLTVTAVASSGHELPPFGAGVVAGTAAMAVLPLRDRLQRLVTRMLYGHRGRPYEALQRLAERTHDASSIDTVLAEIASSVSASLRVPWAHVEAEGHAMTRGHRPEQASDHVTPLLSGEMRVGAITVAAGPGRSFREDDERLLADLGRHAGVAVQAVLLAEAVMTSRQRLVLAREEERRRLRRDLHDELGPTLASIAMQMAALRSIVHTDPHTVAEQLGRLQRAAQTSLQDVRRVSRELRPPALDEVGFSAALRQLAEGLGLALRMRDVVVPRLPAAVEVAAYRIAAEALTNIARHATTPEAELSVVLVGDSIVLEIRDHGEGLDGRGSGGVGLIGMRERAEELGGSLLVASEAGQGVTVTATLPLGAMQPETSP